MQLKLTASTAEDLARILNPKPVGDTVNVHVREPVPETRPDFAKMQRFVDTPDYSKVFKK